MKIINYTLSLAILIMILLVTIKECRATETIAQDSTGMVVMLKEKYGGYVLDTCTAVLSHNGQFITVHYDRPSSWYPVSFTSVRIIQKNVIIRKKLIDELINNQQRIETLLHLLKEVLNEKDHHNN